jgi:hypothetical protein
MAETISEHAEELADRTAPHEMPESRTRRIEFFAALILAMATTATAWAAYQSALWNSAQGDHATRATKAIVRSSKYAKLAEQKLSLHTTLFMHYATALLANNAALEDFTLKRLPEPLKTATIAWKATQPLTNPSAPVSPFEMAQYQLSERAEEERWESIAEQEFAAGVHAGEIADRYLLYTIIFASVLFFAGISGKFSIKLTNEIALTIGALLLLGGLFVLFTTPITY